jgi:hypothetical protein
MEANAVSHIGSDHLISIIAGKIEGLVSISTKENNILESFKAVRTKNNSHTYYKIND